MADTAEIQWCPSCRAWAKSSRLNWPGEARSAAPGPAPGAAGTNSYRDGHECQSCGTTFVTTRHLGWSPKRCLG